MEFSALGATPTYKEVGSGSKLALWWQGWGRTGECIRQVPAASALRSSSRGPFTRSVTRNAPPGLSFPAGQETSWEKPREQAAEFHFLYSSSRCVQKRLSKWDAASLQSVVQPLPSVPPYCFALWGLKDFPVVFLKHKGSWQSSTTITDEQLDLDREWTVARYEWKKRKDPWKSGLWKGADIFPLLLR